LVLGEQIVSASLPNISGDDTKKSLTTTDQRSIISIDAAAFLVTRRG